MAVEHTPAWAEQVYAGRNWRSCYRADGTPKVRLSRAAAKRMRDDLRRKGDQVDMYRCDLGCGSWHVGHSR